MMLSQKEYEEQIENKPKSLFNKISSYEEYVEKYKAREKQLKEKRGG